MFVRRNFSVSRTPSQELSVLIGPFRLAILTCFKLSPETVRLGLVSAILAASSPQQLPDPGALLERKARSHFSYFSAKCSHPQFQEYTHSTHALTTSALPVISSSLSL